MRDSSGIRVVDIDDARSGDSIGTFRSWTIDGQPRLTIDSVPESGETRALYEPTAAIPLEDGVAVLEEQSIFVFDRDGSLLRTLGRTGDGPGEYRQIQAIRVIAGDTVVVWDAELARLTVYPPGHGVPAKTMTPRPVLRQFPTLVGVDGDQLLLREGLDFAAIFGRGTGAHRDTTMVVRYSVESGEAIDTVGVWPGAFLYAWVDGARFSFRALPYGSQTYFSLAGGRLYVISGDHYEIQVYDLPDVNLTMLIREPYRQRRVVSAADRRDYEALQLESAADRAVEQSFLSSIEFPTHRPSYDRLLIDDMLRIWVREGDGTNSWRVFHADGNPAGAVTLPDGFDVDGVRGNEVFGIQTIDSMYKRVHVYAITSY